MVGSIKLWAYGARPKTLLVSIAPVMIASVMAFKAGNFSPSICFWTLLAALSIQVGTNYSNDYFDYKKGVDTKARKGSYKLLERKLVTLSQMKLAFIISYLVAAICTLALIKQGGRALLIMSCLSVFFSLLYTYGPFSLSSTGLADLFVFIFFGPVATIFSFYLQTQNITSDVILASIAPGLLSIVPLTINNIRDHVEDNKAGKKTTIVRWGPAFGKLQYFCILVTSFCVPIVFVVYSAKHPLLLLASASLFLSIPLVKTLLGYKNPEELNPLIGKSVLILILYSTLFSIFWVL